MKEYLKTHKIPTISENIREIIRDDVDDATPKEEFLTLSLYNNHPAIRMCENKFCDYLDLSSIQICKHLLNVSKIHNDKNTLKNIIYIHIVKCIIVFITMNENLCIKEQEVSLEDINYVNSYLSKHPDLSVYTFFYDKTTKLFKDFNNKHCSEHVIALTEKTPPTRELLDQNILQNVFPTAPPPQLPSDSQGKFYYISKN